jgi:hypothetical protein
MEWTGRAHSTAGFGQFDILSNDFHNICFLFYFVNYTHNDNSKIKNQKSKL